MMCTESKRIRRVQNLDRISELPEPIILDILSRLPLEDAARASVLSKTWKSFCSLNPILHFNHNLFALQSLVSAEQELQVEQIRDMFMDVVDRRLSEAHRLDFPIRKLALTVAIDDSVYFSRVDTWLELVRQLNVEELCVSVQTADSKWLYMMEDGDLCYKFPVSVLASKRLRSLYVRGCKFGSETFIGDPVNERRLSFFSLQRLCLSHVSIGEYVLENLISCCQGIEVLVLEECTVVMEYLELSKFPKLKKAHIGYLHGVLTNIGIVDTKLECFKCETDDTTCHFSPAACAGIRELTLGGCIINQTGLFKDLTATFPLIEEVDFEMYDIEILKAANNLLRKFRFYSHGSVQVKEVHIDCPNLTLLDCSADGVTQLYADCPKLRHFRYVSDTVPTLVHFSSTTDLEKSSCQIHFKCAYDISWLINLRAFLILVTGRVTHLHLKVTLPMASFKPEELEPFQHFPQYNVRLALSPIYEDMADVAALLDGLLWIIRPTTLTISCKCFYLLKYLCENLAKKSQGNTSGEHFPQTCWLDQLVDFQLESTLDFPDMKENLATLPEQCRTIRNEIKFKLQWSCN